MGKAWLFFITFTVIFWKSSAQTCDKETCETQSECKRHKCGDIGEELGFSACMNRTEADIWIELGGKCKENGGKNWCKYHRKCKCCYPRTCENRRKCDAVQGTCQNLTEAAVWQEERGGEVKWRGRGDWCKDYKSCKCCFPLPTTTSTTSTTTSTTTGPTTTTTLATTTPSCNPPCVHGHCEATNFCVCDEFWDGLTCNKSTCHPPCQNGDCKPDNVCDCKDSGFNGDRCQFIDCKNRELCDNQSGGFCIAKTFLAENPNFPDCTQSDNGRKWCTPMCTCCFGNE